MPAFNAYHGHIGLMLMLSPQPFSGKAELMDERFERAFAFTYDNEGGFVNDVFDTGGPTRYGITQKTLEIWRNRPVTEEDVKSLDLSEAKEIIHALYWIPSGCDKVLLDSVAMAILDASVLFGVKSAIRALQKALENLGHKLELDGIMGPKTLEALNSMNPSHLLKAFSGELHKRVVRIVELSPTKGRFYKGWKNRIDLYATLAKNIPLAQI